MGSRGSQRVKLPRIEQDTKFQFELEEENFKKQEETLDTKLKQQYNKNLTLAQKLGLVTAPPKPMTLEDWSKVEDLSKARDDGFI